MVGVREGGKKMQEAQTCSDEVRESVGMHVLMGIVRLGSTAMIMPKDVPRDDDTP